MSAANTFYKVAGTTTTGVAGRDFSMPANNRLQYDGTPDILVKVNCTLSVNVATGSKLLAFRLAKNGTTLAPTEVEKEVDNTFSALTVIGLVEMSTGDYIELWGENNDDTVNFTVDEMHMIAVGLFK